MGDLTSPGASLSFSGKRWQWRVSHEESVASGDLARLGGLPPFFAPLLALRRLDSLGAIREFMQPRLQSLADPSTMRDMEKAVRRLADAVERGEAVAVFGDYDVDGATASALMARYFRALDRPLRVYIPERLTEKYGPSVEAMSLLAREGMRVVVTVDCGITAFEELEHAARQGLDLIVTDHHQVKDGRLPKAVAVLNPNRHDDPFPHKELAGVGVAFYLLMGLNRELRQRGWFAAGRQEPDLKRLLDLVAVGTIADVSALVGLNRALVSVGLQGVRARGNAGLRALMERARLGEEVGAGQVGFHLGPRLNAGGRMGQGGLGFELLVTDDPHRAGEIAEILERSNQERQNVEQEILAHALQRIEAEQLAERRLGWVVAGKGWHPGVIGIVASRLAERFYRPVVVVAVDPVSGIGKGSGRSIAGVNLLAAIHACEALLVEHGGHKAAAGLTVREENLPRLAEAFDAAMRAQNPPERFHPLLEVDGWLPMAYATMDSARLIQGFQPFGVGNPEPVFLLEGVRLHGVRLLKERHVKCRIESGGAPPLDGIAFGVLPGPLGEGMLAAERDGRRVDLAGVLAINRFHGRESVQVQIKDARWSNAGKV